MVQEEERGSTYQNQWFHPKHEDKVHRLNLCFPVIFRDAQGEREHAGGMVTCQILFKKRRSLANSESEQCNNDLIKQSYVVHLKGLFRRFVKLAIQVFLLHRVSMK